MASASTAVGKLNNHDRVREMAEPDCVNDTWLVWMEEALRIIPRDHRVLSGAVGIWLRQIYENLFTYCESRLSEDLLIETMRSYKNIPCILECLYQ